MRNLEEGQYQFASSISNGSQGKCPHLRGEKQSKSRGAEDCSRPKQFCKRGIKGSRRRSKTGSIVRGKGEGRGTRTRQCRGLLY